MRTPEQEIRDTTAAWDQAMVGNDAQAIGRFIGDEWAIIGPDGGVGDKPRFLALVASGELAHDVMETHELEVRVYGDTAVTVARGLSGGAWRGAPFLLGERVSCVFVRRDGRWQCVLTHLSPLPADTE
ncbi:nuclear transport factor 2 family protein [Pseudoxanthomonas suwonensis]|uniref:DUF4440 domain-containing protein n=1 Tax=Pseudoxanthomonas suwonensis TaxID=314722 RepID=A0A0E3Z0J0_9GAMM|nr:nuclear transport factor 2 family protein [Pseudoxanthomonas suwonensis]AKC86589.1 hypothetical protein WQ53_07230 [Pseudoxanthomonas suwonensis]